MTDTQVIHVLAISGSLRKGSYNTALLQAARELAPKDMAINIYDGLASIPPYDDDIRLIGYPPTVAALRESVRAADAVIFATPEYNRSFSGILKNAIDWLSRPPDQPLDAKPAVVMGGRRPREPGYCSRELPATPGFVDSIRTRATGARSVGRRRTQQVQ
jgi:chromate reductase, NAD(P)H dehydrogenase (quinone)